eukprot:1810713-Rhodomonas_salina.1
MEEHEKSNRGAKCRTRKRGSKDGKVQKKKKERERERERGVSGETTNGTEREQRAVLGENTTATEWAVTML